MDLDEVMAQLAAKGSETYKRTLLRHGAREPFFGVKVADLKVIQKKLKGDQALALQLFATGNGDAQYLAGLVADGRRMTPAQLQTWAETASWGMISNHSVPWVAAEHPEAFALASAWIDANRKASPAPDGIPSPRSRRPSPTPTSRSSASPRSSTASPRPSRNRPTMCAT